jgi:hypothetical protein
MPAVENKQEQPAEKTDAMDSETEMELNACCLPIRQAIVRLVVGLALKKRRKKPCENSHG